MIFTEYYDILYYLFNESTDNGYPAFINFSNRSCLFVSLNAADSNQWQSPESVTGTELVDLQKAKEMHDQGVLFIDVGSPRQYSKRHIPGAVNLYVKADFTEQNL